MLTHMLGNSYGLQDLLAYLLAVGAVLGCGLSKATKAAQTPLVLLAVVSLVAERMLMRSCNQHLDVDPTGQVGSQERKGKLMPLGIHGFASLLLAITTVAPVVCIDSLQHCGQLQNHWSGEALMLY